MSLTINKYHLSERLLSDSQFISFVYRNCYLLLTLLMYFNFLIRDESERILEEDPRIVLTPLKSHEEC